MGVSKARKRFRKFLGILLLLSLCFFSVSSYFYVNVKTKRIKILDIAPTLFMIDIYQHQARAMIGSQNDRYAIAKELNRKGLFSAQYGQAGLDMMQGLADEGYQPAILVLNKEAWKRRGQ